MLIFHQKLAKFMSNCQKLNVSHGWYFLNTLLQSTNFSHSWYFLNARFFFSINAILFYWKLAKFAIFHHLLSKYKLSLEIFFKCVIFFGINTTLFCQKSEKFETIRRNMNFRCSWYLLKVHFPSPPNMLLFCWISSKFKTNCPNINFFYGWYFYNVQLSGVNMSLFSY